MESEQAPLKSDRILAQIREAHRSREIVDVEAELVKIVVFLSAGSRYGFYGSAIREILPPCAVSWVPGLPDYLPGLINIRGDIESVIDLRRILSGEPSDAETCQVAVAVHDDFRSGIMIDAIDDVVDIPVDAIKPPLTTLQGAARDLVAGEIERDDGLIILLDLEKLAVKVRL